MRYSIGPSDRIYLKGYGILSSAKTMGKHLSNKYSQNLLHSAKKSTTDAIKTASKRAIQNTAKATGDLIGSKLLIKQHVFPKRLHRNCIQWNCALNNYKMTKWKHQKKIHISRRKATNY